ncbi:DUF4012 domain-containing protein [Leucobacter sp. W1038]|uniref:DUF4012 domain-containing protein n=1 Tax=Leucobacter sp. W1038 TaxID=3438281 RepID=UPI003D978B47
MIDTTTAPAAQPLRTRPRRRRRRTWVWIIVGLLAALVAITAWIGIRGWLAYQEVQTARAAVTSIGEQLTADPAAAAALLAETGTHTERAAGLTSDPIWRAAEFVPGLGPNLAAFRVTADSLDAVVREIGVPLIEPASQLEGALKPVDGRLDPAPLLAMQPVAADAAARITEVEAAMAGIDTDALLRPLSEAVDEFAAQLAPVAGGVHAVHGATQLVPALLGADGPRYTLLLFLNNAELRSTVGIPGALALVHTDQGAISLAQQASTRDFPKFDEPVMTLPPEIRGVYGDRPALWIQNVTYAPEFPLSGELAVTMWERQFGTRPQAVIALDPFTLAGILGATGPITLTSGETLSSENAVQFLLHDVYISYPEPAMQDLVFADAAAQVFDAVASGGYDPVALIGALATATQENRVRVWSSIETEQAVIAGSQIAGTLPQSTPGEARFAMLLNDGTGSKMDYYLASSVEVVSGGCPVDAADPRVTLRVTLTNTAPADAGATLPDYITGGGWFVDMPKGDILTLAQVYAPPGFELQRMTFDGAPEGPGSSEFAFERSLATWNPRLTPGQSSVLELEYFAIDHAGAELAWQQTPTFQHTGTDPAGRLC